MLHQPNKDTDNHGPASSSMPALPLNPSFSHCRTAGTQESRGDTWLLTQVDVSSITAERKPVVANRHDMGVCTHKSRALLLLLVRRMGLTGK